MTLRKCKNELKKRFNCVVEKVCEIEMVTMKLHALDHLGEDLDKC